MSSLTQTFAASPVIEDRRLLPILEKVEARERLSYEDGVTYFARPIF